MATPAQLDEKAKQRPPASNPIHGIAAEAQLAEKLRKDREGASLTGAATSAQLAEKARQDQAGSSSEGFATEAQLAEKRGRDQTTSYGAYATDAQLAEKGRRDPAAPSPYGAFTTEELLAEMARREQAAPSPYGQYATEAQLAEKARFTNVPPLPPRTASVSTPAPPPYTSDDAKRSELISEQWRSHDPRSSSTHSLVPSESRRNGKRTLLIIFIHGFMGNETSFQSFPAHVHNLLTILVEETHAVHTKIYPRYKSRKDIQFARDDFSIW